MNFKEYLKKTAVIAAEEQTVLDELSDYVVKNSDLSPLEYRAARSSLQTIIENAIGKARRILNHQGCPFVPQRAGEGFDVLRQVGALSDPEYRALRSAVGFRNAMIHDYMEFDRKVLIEIIRQKSYRQVLDFLNNDAEYPAVVIKRIENYAP